MPSFFKPWLKLCLGESPLETTLLVSPKGMNFITKNDVQDEGLFQTNGECRRCLEDPRRTRDCATKNQYKSYEQPSWTENKFQTIISKTNPVRSPNWGKLDLGLNSECQCMLERHSTTEPYLKFNVQIREQVKFQGAAKNKRTTSQKLM